MAAEALQMGLVTHVVPADRLVDEALCLAKIIAANAPITLRGIKDIMRRTYELNLESVMQLEIEGMLSCLETEDILEGTRAFLERRQPVYRGR